MSKIWKILLIHGDSIRFSATPSIDARRPSATLVDFFNPVFLKIAEFIDSSVVRSGEPMVANTILLIGLARPGVTLESARRGDSATQGKIVPNEQKIRVGDVAPDFRLPAIGGGTLSLGDFRDRSEVVLFFYPKDNTPACTLEACGFRDSYEVFREAGAEVIGISGDSPESHERFASRFRLPFPLLSDPDGRVAASYGVNRTFGIFPGRVTYLIDRAGIIRHIFSSQLLPTKHVSETLAMLRKLSAAPG